MVPYLFLLAFNEFTSGKLLIAIKLPEVCVGGLLEVETVVNDVASGISPVADAGESYEFLDQGVDHPL